MGGWWERLIRTVKLSLAKTLHLTRVPRSELETLIIEIEASVNSRPLTYVSSDIRDAQALTPSHFLIGRTMGEKNAHRS